MKIAYIHNTDHNLEYDVKIKVSSLKSIYNFLQCYDYSGYEECHQEDLETIEKKIKYGDLPVRSIFNYSESFEEIIENIRKDLQNKHFHTDKILPDHASKYLFGECTYLSEFYKDYLDDNALKVINFWINSIDNEEDRKEFGAYFQRFYIYDRVIAINTIE